MLEEDGINGIAAPKANGGAYAIVDHSFDVVVVGAGGAGLRATVCERVGNTLVTQAVRSPACEQPTVARSPAPPAPTTTTSKV